MFVIKILIEENADISEIEVVIRCKEFNGEAEEVLARLKRADEKIAGVADGKTHLVNPNEILYFESVDKKDFFYTKDAVFETSLRLYEVEHMVGHRGFMRISKSTIVNISQIETISNNFNATLTLTMQNGERITVSRLYAPILKERLGM